jgi:hypothetical protein
MNDDKLGRALRSMGDTYVRENPADFEALREGMQRRRWRKWFLTGFGTAAVTATAVIALVFVFSSDPTDDAGVPSSGSEGLEITASYQMGPVTEVAAGLESAFVVGEGSVTRVDADGGEAWATQLPGTPSDIIHTKTEIWVSVGGDDDALYRLDRATGTPTRIDLGTFDGPGRLHVAEFAARVITDYGVVLVPRDTFQPEPLFEADVRDIAFGRRGFWVLETDGTLTVIDPHTGAPAPLETAELPGVQGEITYLREALWFGSPGDQILTRLDETTGTITGSVDLPGDYIDIDASSSGMWVLVATDSGGELIEADPTDGSLLANSITFDSQPRDLSTDDVGVWVTLADGRLVRVED